MNRGFGISTLFAGPSGTGKTMAAEVIAAALRLNLYRIDLSAVVNKYIGETEKNLRRLFDAAEDSGAILCFDEADALFGKRSEVKDSHDRYANIEINYLLQRIESYGGLAMLTSNMKAALDSAFTRRLRFIVNVPFPVVADRRRLWERAFLQDDVRQGLSAPPLGALDYDRLARLNLAGGQIHNVALNAAFLAAHTGTGVTMALILDAARAEFGKTDRPINGADFRWSEPARLARILTPGGCHGAGHESESAHRSARARGCVGVSARGTRAVDGGRGRVDATDLVGREADPLVILYRVIGLAGSRYRINVRITQARIQTFFWYPLRAAERRMHQSLALLCNRQHFIGADAVLAAAGCAICRCRHISELTLEARRLRPDLVVVEFSAADARNVLLAVDELHRHDRRLPFVFLTNDRSEETLLEALRAGVKDYFHDPLDPAALVESLRRCVASVANRIPRTNTGTDDSEQRFIASSPAIQSIDDYLSRVAQRDVTVLITGETGTGKELAAARIHSRSARRNGRFVPVNCAAIPDSLIESELFGFESGAFTGAARPHEGLLQLANRGTVFLDEVGDLGPQAQAKILRALEAREVYRLGGKRPEKLDVRIVAATNHDLEKSVEQGHFRKDLYFRLNVARVHLPPLRERRSDIVPLLEHYLSALNQQSAHAVNGFSAEATHVLQAYDWPGNVRELRNLVEALLVTAPRGAIQVADLPEDFRRRLHQLCSLEEAERRRLMEALLTAQWNKSKAATLLQCSRMTLYRKMVKYSVASNHPLRTPMSQTPVTPGRRKNAS